MPRIVRQCLCVAASKQNITCVLLCLTLVGPAFAAGGFTLTDFANTSNDGDVNGDTPPRAWQPWTFAPVERTTEYRVVKDASAGKPVLRARAQAAGSALRRDLPSSVQGYQNLRWRWKIEQPLANADITLKAQDDAVARILVIYAYDPARLSFAQRARYALARAIYGEWPPHAILNYVWARQQHKGSVIANPVSDRAQVIVIEDAQSPAGVWREQPRNVAADYRKVFGEAPPPIAAIAVMTDTDVTRETATAWYTDLVLTP